jgi:hypothetical protein
MEMRQSSKQTGISLFPVYAITLILGISAIVIIGILFLSAFSKTPYFFPQCLLVDLLEYFLDMYITGCEITK